MLPNGFKHLEEAKMKMANSRRGKKHSEETKRKLKKARARQIPPMLGKRQSKESIRKRTETRRKNGWWRTPKSKSNTTFQKGQIPWNKNVVGEKSYSWKGGKRAYFSRNAKRIVEEHINRKLRRGEIIHHLDHNWKNNSIDNLYLLPSNSEHTKYHQFKEKLVMKALHLKKVVSVRYISST